MQNSRRGVFKGHAQAKVEEPVLPRAGLGRLLLAEPLFVLLGYGLLLLLIRYAGQPLIRAAFATALGIFGSGYSVAAVLFPRRSQLDGVARAAIAGALTMGLGGAIGFLLALSEWGLSLHSFLVATAALNVLCYAGSILRRRNLPEAELPDGPLKLKRIADWWAGEPGTGRLLAVLLVLLLFAGVGALYQAAITPSPDPAMTEFFLLDQNGRLDDLPKTAIAGQPLALTLGIVNRMSGPGVYQVHATVDGQSIGSTQPVTVAVGETRTVSLQVEMPERASGATRLLIVLTRDGQPHRTLDLWLDVSRS